MVYKENKMDNSTRTKDVDTYYAEDGLKDAICCLCGEKSPDREFRGLGVCTHCIEYIRGKG
jgi:hypothetical protein